jgi:hypothetical protein
MKMRYEFGLILMIIGLAVLVINFTNCANINQGSDEYNETVFSDEGFDCTTGRICTDEKDMECFTDDYFFEREPGIICQRYPPQAKTKKSSRGPASISKPIQRMPAVYQQRKSLQQAK